jgi:MFS family permease
MVLNNKSGQDQIVMNTIDNSIVVNKNNEKIILENGVNVGFVDKEILRQKRKEKKKKKESLHYSIIDGSFWSAMFGFGERYLPAFAVFLNATNTQIGLLTSLPILVSSIIQLFSAKLIDVFNSRKKVVLFFGLIQAFSWLLILSSFFFGEFSVYFLILFSTIYWVIGMISNPAWNSWMGDLVDENNRGNYFGKRNRILGVVILFSTISAGIILDYFSLTNIEQYFGFFIIFFIALIARLFSVYFINKQYEPERKKEIKGTEANFFDFIKNAGLTNYGMFVIFLSLFNFSIYLAAPYFVAYMLYDLSFSYFQLMLMISIVFLARYISLPAWGFLSDKYGNRKILSFTALMIPFVPLLWMSTTNFYYLILVELYSGIFWAGFELSSFNFVFDTTTPDKRAKYISYYNAINGVMIFLGTMLGSLLVFKTTFFWSDYYPVFLTSFFSRIIIVIYFISKLKEVRKVSQTTYKKIFLKATNMIITESFNNFTFFLTYPKQFKIYVNPKTYFTRGAMVLDGVIKITNKTIELQSKGVKKIISLGKNEFAVIYDFEDKTMVEIKKFSILEILKIIELQKKGWDIMKIGKIVKINPTLIHPKQTLLNKLFFKKEQIKK